MANSNREFGAAVRFIPILGVAIFIGIGFVTGAIVLSLLKLYVLNQIHHIGITSEGIQYDKNFWQWKQVSKVDYVIAQTAGIARLQIHTKRGWSVGALTLPVDLTCNEADQIIGKLRGELDKSGHQVAWGEMWSNHR